MSLVRFITYIYEDDKDYEFVFFSTQSVFILKGCAFLIKPTGTEYKVLRHCKFASPVAKTKFFVTMLQNCSGPPHKVYIDGVGHPLTSLNRRVQEIHPRSEEACPSSLTVDIDHHYH